VLTVGAHGLASAESRGINRVEAKGVEGGMPGLLDGWYVAALS